VRRPDWTYGFFYQRWSRLLHRFNLHQTREIGPLEDGSTVIKCEWCGLSQWKRPMRTPDHPEGKCEECEGEGCFACGRPGWHPEDQP